MCFEWVYVLERKWQKERKTERGVNPQSGTPLGLQEPQGPSVFSSSWISQTWCQNSFTAGMLPKEKREWCLNTARHVSAPTHKQGNTYSVLMKWIIKIQLLLEFYYLSLVNFKCSVITWNKSKTYFCLQMPGVISGLNELFWILLPMKLWVIY